ncbi:MAG: FAD-dependent oxidoreductase [Thermoleophilia bacterium]
MSDALDRLFSPLAVGPVTLRNRIVSPPHGTGFAQGGLPSERQLAYYEARARGGAALIVVGSLHVHELQFAAPGENLAADPRAVEAYRRIAEAVHRHGALISGQLHFSGRQAGAMGHRRPVLAASPLASPQVREIPKELEPWEIEDLIERFARSAANVRAGEWDGVEVFCSQGYGLNQFLSPSTNHREDEWGGSLENRMRVLLRVVRVVREAVGPGLLVGVRLSLDDMVEGGLGPEEAGLVAQALEASGDVDYVNASAASTRDWPLWIADLGHPQGLFVPLAADLRAQVRLPIAIATRIKDPLHAEAILAEGNVDLIGMNRALIADPDLPRKARAGRLTEIRPCVNANQGCLGRVLAGYPMSCTVNPAVGREAEVGGLAPAAEPRRVAIAGGGPAGLQAAVVAAARGHAVTLFEERDWLGGQLRLAARAASRRELAEVCDWLERELVRLGVELRLGVRADAAALAGFDRVVLATGSTPVRTGFASFRPHVLAVPGCDLPHVLTAWEAVERPERVGERVVVLEDDPHVQATTAAELLAEHGKRVAIVTRNQVVGTSTGPVGAEFLYRRLKRAGIELVPCTWVDAIEPGRVRLFDVYSDEPSTREADAVVLCTGNRVRDELYRELRLAAPSVEPVRIGDCLAPRKLDDAIWDGFEAGRAL